MLLQSQYAMIWMHEQSQLYRPNRLLGRWRLATEVQHRVSLCSEALRFCRMFYGSLLRIDDYIYDTRSQIYSLPG